MKKQNIDEKEIKDTTSGVEAAELRETPENVDQITEEVKEDNSKMKKEKSSKKDKKETEISAAKEELNKMKDELAESKDKYLRLYSEFENFRRRTAKEKLDMVQTANEDLIVSLLPVLDDFERAQKSFEDEADVKSLNEGITLIQNKFKKVLEQKGLVTMDNSQGMSFDPELHEAITQIPAPEDKLKGKVVDVIEKGYLLKEKVIRYAKVVIGN